MRKLCFNFCRIARNSKLKFYRITQGIILLSRILSYSLFMTNLFYMCTEIAWSVDLCVTLTHCGRVSGCSVVTMGLDIWSTLLCTHFYWNWERSNKGSFHSQFIGSKLDKLLFELEIICREEEQLSILRLLDNVVVVVVVALGRSKFSRLADDDFVRCKLLGEFAIFQSFI